MQVCLLRVESTGLSKRNSAKFKLADRAVHSQVTLSDSTWGENFQKGDISFEQPCRGVRIPAWNPK